MVQSTFSRYNPCSSRFPKNAFGANQLAVRDPLDVPDFLELLEDEDKSTRERLWKKPAQNTARTSEVALTSLICGAWHDGMVTSYLQRLQQ
jgi:hypothetical protein